MAFCVVKVYLLKGKRLCFASLEVTFYKLLLSDKNKSGKLVVFVYRTADILYVH